MGQWQAVHSRIELWEILRDSRDSWSRDSWSRDSWSRDSWSRDSI